MSFAILTALFQQQQAPALVTQDSLEHSNNARLAMDHAQLVLEPQIINASLVLMAELSTTEFVPATALVDSL